MRHFPLIAAILLILMACAIRVVPVLLHLTPLWNFAPLMSIAFCGGIYLPRMWAWLVPLLALFVSDLVLNLHYQASLFSGEMLASYACYGLAILLGMRLGRQPRWSWILGGVLVNALLFYVVTNSLAWLGNPVYPRNLSGWVQALTMGDPRFSPTWTFLRNSIASDLLYTGLFVLSMRLAQAKMTFQFSPDHRTMTPAA